MSVVNLKYGVGVFGLKRATEEQEISSSEEKRQKVDLEEFVAEAASEVAEEDTDQSEIEWLIDASLSDDPFKNHLAKKILGQNSLETEVPKNEEIPKPNSIFLYAIYL